MPTPEGEERETSATGTSAARSAGAAKTSSSDNQLALVPGTEGVDVIDLVTGIRWPLGSRIQEETATIVADGSHVVQMLGNEALGLWTLRLPTKREDVASWLGGITNATANLGPSSVTWAE